ncbi:MAG: PsiF family protein [Steroidobacterales bacterium]
MIRHRQVLVYVAACAIAAFAVNASADNSQQTKMTTCNAEAKSKNLAGDDRKAFMKTCLSATPAAAPAAPMNSQQQKMKTCNADAKKQGLTGDARKQFMSSCLKGS